MRLISVNSGQIRTQNIDGAQVQTAYVKSRVSTPWRIAEGGIAGNEIAAHTDHLYAFDRASYSYWAEQLEVDRSAWPDGFFAENLTLETIDASALRVGDRLKLGESTLVVTGPRVPCWKLSWRLGLPKTFIREFRLSGRSGVYLGVIEPGAVAEGDELRLVQSDAENPTVVELARLCDPGGEVSDEEAAVVQRALACDDLSQTVRMMLTLKQGNIARVRGQSSVAWRGWREFVVDHSVQESADVHSFSFRPADGDELAVFEAGQHVAVQLSASDGSAFVRTWSLSEFTSAPSRYRITVRERPDSRGIPVLRDAVKAGDSVLLRAPGGEFTLSMGGFRPVVLIAAGVGISPLMAMVHAHVSRGASAPPLWLFYGFRGGEDVPFRAELEALAAEWEDFHLFMFDSSASSDDGSVSAGRISVDAVIHALEGNYIRIPAGRLDAPWFETDFYLCGPDDFNRSMRDGLVSAGANAHQVFAEEFFRPTELQPVVVRRENARVRFDASDVELDWVAKESRTLLETGEDSELDLPSYCRSGSCNTCAAKVLRGSVSGAVVDADDGSKIALLCSSYPESDEVWLDA